MLRGRSLLVLLVLGLLVCVGIYVYEENSTFPKELRTDVAYGIFGDWGGGRGVIELDPEHLEKILDSLNLLPRDAMSCGYDYYLKIYRPNSSNIVILINTECLYLTISDTDIRKDIRAGNFYSLTWRFRRWVTRLASELMATSRFLYDFRVPVHQEFNELSSNIKLFKKGMILNPDGREGERNPNISLKYSDKISNYPYLSTLRGMPPQSDLGDFEPDNHFLLLINDERLKSRIAEMSPVSFREIVSNLEEMTFSREIKIFIRGALPEEDIEDMRRIWEQINGEDTFNYSAEPEYTIEFITDNELKDSEIVDLKERYGIRMIS